MADEMAEINNNNNSESEGEDLYGENMAQDYEPRPELDHYDPAMLDDAQHERMSIQDRMAVQRALDERDRRERGERSPSPAARVAGGDRFTTPLGVQGRSGVESGAGDETEKKQEKAAGDVGGPPGLGLAQNRFSCGFGGGRLLAEMNNTSTQLPEPLLTIP